MQCCFYITPSLRPKSFRMPKTPSSRGFDRQKSTWRSVETLSNAKPPSDFASFNVSASLKTGVQRKLEVNYENNPTRQPLYRPPARNNPAPGYVGRNNRKTWDIPDEKLVHSIRGMVYNKLADVAADKFTPLKLNYGKVSDLTNKLVQQGSTYGKVSDVADKFTQLK